MRSAGSSHVLIDRRQLQEVPRHKPADCPQLRHALLSPEPACRPEQHKGTGSLYPGPISKENLPSRHSSRETAESCAGPSRFTPTRFGAIPSISLAVSPGINPLSRLGQASEDVSSCVAGIGQRGANPFAELLKTLLFWQQNQAIPKPQNRKRRPGAKTQIFTELLGNRELAFFSDPRGSQKFQRWVNSGHGRKILPHFSRPSPRATS